MKKVISLFLILLLVTACSTNKYETIDANRALALINEGVIIIDVRTKEEYDESHIISAINIPLDEIESISYSKETPLIVYCASGVRSVQAAKTLSKMGYTTIYNLDGGILNSGELLED